MRKHALPTNKELTALGYSPGQVSDILRKRRLPSLERAVEIEDKLKIPARFWIDRIRASA